MLHRKSWLSSGSSALLTVWLAGCAYDVDEVVEASSQALSAGSASDRAQLALRWAPVHHQDVDQTGSHAPGRRRRLHHTL